MTVRQAVPDSISSGFSMKRRLVESARLGQPLRSGARK